MRTALKLRYLYGTYSVHNAVLQKSVPAEIRQLILQVRNDEDTLTDLCGNILLQHDCMNAFFVR